MEDIDRAAVQVLNIPFDTWLPRQRWYAGRGRTLTATTPVVAVPLRDDLVLVLLDASYADGTSERYQIIVGLGDGAAVHAGATISAHAGRVAYDGLFDPEAARYLLKLIDDAATIGAVDFAKEPGVRLPLDVAPR